MTKSSKSKLWRWKREQSIVYMDIPWVCQLYSSVWPNIESYLDIVKQILLKIFYLPSSVTIDVDPVVTQARTGRDTGRVPGPRPPDGIEIVFAGNIDMAKHFSCHHTSLLENQF